MNTVTIGPEWRNLLTFVRYSLSPPNFDVNRTPAVLTVAPAWGFARLRRFALVGIPFFMALVAFSAFGFEAVDAGDRFEAVLALLAAAGLWAVLTLLPKRLLATFTDDEVTVQEGGIRTPRRHWREPLAAYAGLAWRCHRVEHWYMTFQIGGRTEYRRRASPVVNEYHWIELVHAADPARSLMLRMQKGEADMRESLGLYSRRLARPVVAERSEDRLA